MSGIATVQHFQTAAKRAGLYYDEDLLEKPLAPEVLALISAEVAAKYRIVPVGLEDDVLILVTYSEQAFKSQMQIARELERPVRLLFTEKENLHMALSEYYNVRPDALGQRSMEQSVDQIDATPLKRKINVMLQDAIKKKASDIHVLPHEMGIQVLFRINGHLMDVSAVYTFKPEEAANVVNILKTMDTSGQMDVVKSIMPGKGSFEMTHGTMRVEVRLSTVPIASGLQKVNLRLLRQGKKKVELGELGYRPEDLQAIRLSLLQSATGMFLNSGPTGAGKTTSLYAQILEVLEMRGEPLNITTIEDPVELHEPLFCQVQVRESQVEELSLTAPKILKVGLRQDPDIFLYGEIRDQLDAEVALEAARTGHKVFSTVHAKDCISTIARLLDLKVSRTSLLSELNMIISQRLVGLLCPHCSEPHQLTEDESRILSQTERERLTGPDARLRRRGPKEAYMQCPHCMYGYTGRKAVVEYVVFDMELRDLFLQDVRFADIERILKKKNFQSMWEKGLELVAAGETSLLEVLQVIGK